MLMIIICRFGLFWSLVVFNFGGSKGLVIEAARVQKNYRSQDEETGHEENFNHNF